MKKIRRFIIVLIFILIIVFVSYYVYDNYIKETNEVKIIKKISGYGYELNNHETKLYKDTFDELDKVLSKKPVNYEMYAKTISKLFIIDFYTLDNKVSKNDIGGVQFIKDSMKDNFIEEARSTFYKYVEQKEERAQKLPEVSSIDSVEVSKTTFTINDITDKDTTTVKKTTTATKGTEYEAYEVSIKWSYKKDLGYETKANIILVKEGKKLYIVEMD